MAFNAKEMACIGISGAGAAINHVYFYANSAGDTVTANDFFNAFASQITTGDVLIVGGAAPRLASLVNTAGDITLADFDVTAA